MTSKLSPTLASMLALIPTRTPGADAELEPHPLLFVPTAHARTFVTTVAAMLNHAPSSSTHRLPRPPPFAQIDMTETSVPTAEPKAAGCCLLL